MPLLLSRMGQPLTLEEEEYLEATWPDPEERHQMRQAYTRDDKGRVILKCLVSSALLSKKHAMVTQRSKEVLGQSHCPVECSSPALNDAGGGIAPLPQLGRGSRTNASQGGPKVSAPGRRAARWRSR